MTREGVREAAALVSLQKDEASGMEQSAIGWETGSGSCLLVLR